MFACSVVAAALIVSGGSGEQDTLDNCKLMAVVNNCSGGASAFDGNIASPSSTLKCMDENGLVYDGSSLGDSTDHHQRK